MKYIFLTLFLVHTALAAPHHVEEEIIDEDVMPMALPQIEEGVVQDIGVQINDEETEIEEGDAEAAFMRMINLGRSYGGMPSFAYGMNRGMRSMMPQNKNALGYSGQSQGYSGQSQGYGYGAQSYGMNPWGGFNPMDQMMGGMGGFGNGMYPNPMDQMMGGMGGMGGFGNGMYPNMMDQMMGGMGGFGNGMYPNPMDQMMGGMGGMGGFGNGMYPNMMDQMMGGMGGFDQMMGGMGGYDQMMGGMGGYDQMMDGMGYMNEKPKQVDYVEFHEYKNEDFPTDYTLPCSDHCGCDQVCKSTRGKSCTCRCPPRCSAPGIFV